MADSTDNAGGVAGRRGRRVAVFGAGVAGLTTAHELAERGFDVTVYERREVPGGKARSLYVPGTGVDGRRDLPGEHGHRMVLGFYRNLPDTLRRIPAASGSGARSGDAAGTTGGCVHDSLIPVTRFDLARADGRPSIPVPVDPRNLDLGEPAMANAALLVSTLGALLEDNPILPREELVFLAQKVSAVFASCDERRFGQWEHTGWWEFIEADRMSADYQRIWGGGVQILEALKPHSASVRTVAQGLESIFFSLFGLGSDGPFDRVFAGPTSEVWLDPWVGQLRGLGVRFAFGSRVDELELRSGRIAAGRVTTRAGTTERVEADWFVVALPADRAVRLWNRALRSADPRLCAMEGLEHTWSNGIQFFLRRPAATIPGHIFHIDAPWKLASISQSKLWHAARFEDTWGDGQARESLSVVISDWDAPGVIYGKPAGKCTRDEIAREVWAQMQAHLNRGDDVVLDDAMVHSWYLDEAITEADDGLHNDEPFLMNSTGSWDLRPDAATGIANLFLAADYVRTYSNVDFATMETANEAARRAVRALLTAAGAGDAPPETFARYELPQFAQAKAVDLERWNQGLPHVLDEEPGL